MRWTVSSACSTSGTGLARFVVLLLALAEVIGSAAACVVASGAVIALVAAHGPTVSRATRRGGFVAGLLAGLGGRPYILLSLEAYSLVIGAGLLFAALAAIMYLTRKIDWDGVRAVPLDPSSYPRTRD